MTISFAARRFVTLIEMMIVMALIAMIIGVVAYNYQGSLDKGKAFATEQSMEKITQALMLHLAEYPNDIDRIESDWQEMVGRSPIIRDSKAITKDGWGKPFTVRVDHDTHEGDAKIVITSDAYIKYKRKH